MWFEISVRFLCWISFRHSHFIATNGYSKNKMMMITRVNMWFIFQLPLVFSVFASIYLSQSWFWRYREKSLIRNKYLEGDYVIYFYDLYKTKHTIMTKENEWNFSSLLRWSNRLWPRSTNHFLVVGLAQKYRKIKSTTINSKNINLLGKIEYHKDHFKK